FLDLISKSGAMDWLKQQLQDISTTVDQMAKDGRLKRWAQDISDAIVSLGQTLRAGVGYLVEYKNQLMFLGKAFVAFRVTQAVQGLATFTKGLIASRAAMVATAAQAAATGSTIGKLGKSLFALARPIPITLLLLGVEAVTSGLTWVARKMNDLEVAERALSDQAERHRIERLQEIAALRQHAAEYKKFQDVAIAGQGAVAAMSDDQRQAYVDQ